MPTSDRVRLVVLFGGQSAEHEVSCTSAYEVLRAIDPQGYEVEAIGITREGGWVRADDATAAVRAGRLSLAEGRLEAAGSVVEPEAALSPSASEDQAVVVLPLLHGTRGEDGTVQGLLELADVPYVGAGVLGSALCMDKLKAKDVVAAHGIPQVGHIGLRDTELGDAHDRVARAGLPYPLFVKPANLGSSVGVSKVASPHELDQAVALAGSYDEFVIIEEGVAAREIELAVLGNAEPRASVAGEIVTSHEFYDYDDKYVDGTSDTMVPAELPEDVASRFGDLAVQAFVALRCDGMARVDFFYEEGGRGPLLNEVNTIPGFTPISMYPKLWAASGLAYPDLIDELVGLAIDRHERRARLSTKR